MESTRELQEKLDSRGYPHDSLINNRVQSIPEHCISSHRLEHIGLVRINALRVASTFCPTAGKTYRKCRIARTNWGSRSSYIVDGATFSPGYTLWVYGMYNWCRVLLYVTL